MVMILKTMNFLELAEKRYSVRDYADKNVEEEKLKKILAAAASESNRIDSTSNLYIFT